MDFFRKRPFFTQVLILIVITMGTFFLRALALELRPMHTDESVHAFKFGQLLEEGVYRYDPGDYHGPTLYDATWLLARLRGVRTYTAIPGETLLRGVPVLFGSATILLLVLMHDGLGRARSLMAAALLACSPAFFYYSRDYIQEILLVFFSMGLVGSLWRYGRSGGAGWAMLAGFWAGLMLTTKETALLALAGVAGAAALHRAFTPHRFFPSRRRAATRLLCHLALGLAAAALVFAGLITHFLSHPQALADFLSGLSAQVTRAFSGAIAAGTADHAHPFGFYLKREFFWRQGPRTGWPHGVVLALALAGLAAAFGQKRMARKRRRLLRFIALYALLMTLGYCLIPYKTPWCALNFLWPLLLVAAHGACSLFERLPGKPLKMLFTLAMLAVLGFLGRNIYWDNFVYPADPRTPYVYAQTSVDLKRLMTRVETLARLHPARRSMPIQVIFPQEDYWPLPWSLRAYDHAGYWSAPPAQLTTPVIISSPPLAARLQAACPNCYQQEYYGLRPDVLAVLSIRRDLWDAFLRQQAMPEQAAP